MGIRINGGDEVKEDIHGQAKRDSIDLARKISSIGEVRGEISKEPSSVSDEEIGRFETGNDYRRTSLDREADWLT